MSRYYNIYIEIIDFNVDKEEDILKTIKQIWPGNYEFFKIGDSNLISGGGDNHLCGGQSEEESFEEIYKALWLSNEAYCQIIINYTFLEDLPYEKFETSRDIYDTIKKGTI